MFKSKGNPLKVHSKVHFLKRMKNFSIGFYTGGGNIDKWSDLSDADKKAKLNKNWYVWWSYRNPDTGLMERQEPNIKEGINIHKNKTARLKAMVEIKRELTDLLESGYSPYHHPTPEKEKSKITEDLEYALGIKKSELTETSFTDYKSRIGKFENYLKEKGFEYTSEINKKAVSEFLNQFNPKTSNNYKVAISSIFSVLSDQGIIDSNFIKELRDKKLKKKAKKIFSEKYIDDVTKKLIDQDPVLTVYVELISYMFWRPIEIVRLEMKNIDFRNMTMRVNTKGKEGKTKIIPSIMFDRLLQFSEGKKGRLFELQAAQDRDKRTYLTKQFKKFRESNNLDPELTPYDFRHTKITQLYKVIRKTASIDDSIKKLSLITGHDSKAIHNYIHVNDIELPEDYSELFTK